MTAGERELFQVDPEPEGRRRRQRPDSKSILLLSEMRELKVSKCSPRFGQTDSRRPFKLTYANRQWPPSSQSVSQSVAFALLCPEWKLASRRLKLMIQGARKKGRKEGAWARGTAGVDSNSSYETIQFNGAFPTAMECISSSCYSFRGSGSLVGKESIPLLNQKGGKYSDRGSRSPHTSNSVHTGKAGNRCGTSPP